MNEKQLNKIGQFLLDHNLINDYDYYTPSDKHEWFTFTLILDNPNLDTIEIDFNKEFGYIMNIRHTSELELLDMED